MPHETTQDTTQDGWRPDVLGDGYEQRTLELPDDDEGPVVATLVRYAPPTTEAVRPARAVLYLHGWSDYFFQTELAEHWHAQGAAFYALDLRKYGRSIQPHQGHAAGGGRIIGVHDRDLVAVPHRTQR